MMFGTREPFEYFCCTACDTLQIHNVLEGDELMRHYPSNYYSHNASAQPGAFRWLVTQHDEYKLHGGKPILGKFIKSRLTEGIFRVLLGGDVVRMLAELGTDREARILDVGCGTGGCSTGCPGLDSIICEVRTRSSRLTASPLKVCL
ncbi:putative methyltransferase [Mycolicibacterium fortuitum]|uniref:Putative methyltransferase n=1 Tax=Mycolicibacterium fortuitum TaxID=1766 RepID=A0A378U9K5_MYCFO|nr:putative methyltransferase [Mycolicibacterium fortuitum]